MRIFTTFYIILKIELSIQLSTGTLKLTSTNKTGEEMKHCVLQTIDNYFDDSITVVMFEEDRDSSGIWEELVKSIKVPIVILPMTSLSEYIPRLHILTVISLGFTALRNYSAFEQNLSEKTNLILVGESDLDEDFYSFHMTMTHKDLNVPNVLLIPKPPSVVMLTTYPFTNASCKRAHSFLQVDVFINGGFRKGVNPFTVGKYDNMHGCRLTCIGFRKPPMGMLKVYQNGSFYFQGPTSEILDILRRRLNFIPEIIIADYNTTFRLNSELVYVNSKNVILKNINSRTIDFAIGDFSFYQFFDSPSVVGHMIFDECLIAGIPYTKRKSPDKRHWSILVDEFSLTFWFIHLVVMVATEFIFYAVTVSHGDESYLTFPQMTFTTLQSQPFHLQLSADSARVLVASWLTYSLIFRTAYQASMWSMMTKPHQDLYMRNLKELLETSLKIVSDPDLIDFLEQQVKSKNRAEILRKKYLPMTAFDFEQMKTNSSSSPPVALIGTKKQLEYFSRFGISVFQTDRLYLLDECLENSFSTPLIFPNGSPLIEPMNRILRRIFETRMVSLKKQFENVYLENMSTQLNASIHTSNKIQKNNIQLANFIGKSIIVLHSFNIVVFVCECVISMIVSLVNYYHATKRCAKCLNKSMF